MQIISLCILKIYLRFILCMWGFILPEWRSEEVIGCLGTGDKHGCETPHKDWKLNLSPLQGQQLFFIAVSPVTCLHVFKYTCTVIIGTSKAVIIRQASRQKLSTSSPWCLLEALPRRIMSSSPVESQPCF